MCCVPLPTPLCVQSHTVYSSIKGSKPSCWEGTYLTLLNPGFPHLFDCKFLYHEYFVTYIVETAPQMPSASVAIHQCCVGTLSVSFLDRFLGKVRNSSTTTSASLSPDWSGNSRHQHQAQDSLACSRVLWDTRPCVSPLLLYMQGSR